MNKKEKKSRDQFGKIVSDSTWMRSDEGKVKLREEYAGGLTPHEVKTKREEFQQRANSAIDRLPLYKQHNLNAIRLPRGAGVSPALFAETVFYLSLLYPEKFEDKTFGEVCDDEGAFRDEEKLLLKMPISAWDRRTVQQVETGPHETNLPCRSSLSKSKAKISAAASGAMALLIFLVIFASVRSVLPQLNDLLYPCARV